MILDEVVAILVEVIGEDFLLDVEVTPETSFNDDLAVESIEFVALAERLREFYGDRVDFVAFVGEMEVDELVSMTVGRLVTHIQSCLGQIDVGQIDVGQIDVGQIDQNGADHG